MNEYKPKINLRKSALLIALPIVLMVLAGWFIARENIYQMLEVIGSANHLFIVLAIAIYFLSVGIWAIRWRMALSFINCRISFGTCYLIICATIFLNNVTPIARVGGDPFGRVYMLHRLENTSYSSGMASVVGEYALTPLLIVSFLMAGLLLQFGKGSLPLTLILIAVWVLAASATIFIPRLFFKKRIAAKGIGGVINRVLGWFRRGRNVEEIGEGIETFYSSSYATIDRWKKVFLIGSWTLLTSALEALRLYSIFLALGYNPTLPMLLVASSLPIIVGFIPLLPGGLVLVEGSLISIFALFGVPLELAIAATLIERGLSFVLSTIVGAGVFSYLGVKIAAKPEVQN